MSMGSGSSKKAKADLKLSDQELQARIGLENMLADHGKQSWDYYLKEYRPVEQQTIDAAKAGLNPDYEGITNMAGAAGADVSRQFDIARAGLTRGMARRGVAPNSEAALTTDASAALGEAAAKAGAMTRADIQEAAARREERRYAEGTTFARRAAVAGMGTGQGAAANATISGAAAGLGATAAGLTSNAGAYNEIAKAQAAAAGAGIGGIISGGLKMYGAYTNPAGIATSL